MDDFAQTLLETHTAAELAEQLSYRIDEMRDLREALEAEREKKAPKTLLARIAELERDLAKVNERLTAAQNLPPPSPLQNSQT